MSNSTTEEITNFWSHHPHGLTFRELTSISPEDKLYMTQNRAAVLAVAAEVNVQIVPEMIELSDASHAA